MQTSFANRTTTSTTSGLSTLIQRAKCRCISLSALVIALITFASPLFAQNDIVIGNSSPLSGPIGPSNKEAIAGAQAYFDEVNERGGINGRKISFLVLDDKQDTKVSLENTRQLIEKNNALALFMYRTSPVLEAIIPVAETARVPIVFPQVGPSFAYDEKLKHVFTIRATYQAEARIAIEQATRLGLKRVAILQADDAFGRDAVKGAEAAMLAAKISPVVVEKFDNKSSDVTNAVAAIVNAQPQAVLLIVTAKGASNFIRSAREKGLNAQFITLSNTSSRAFIEDLGEAGRGVGIMQIVPNPLRGTALSADFMKLFGTKAGNKPSHAALQGYLSARVLVEAIKKTGKNPSREKLGGALESLNIDYGGFRVKFSPTDHHGSDFVELSIVGKDGKVLL
jgi:branched-chain amino acid transport system substrate-binding protein